MKKLFSESDDRGNQIPNRADTLLMVPGCLQNIEFKWRRNYFDHFQIYHIQEDVQLTDAIAFTPCISLSEAEKGDEHKAEADSTIVVSDANTCWMEDRHRVQANTIFVDE